MKSLMRLLQEAESLPDPSSFKEKLKRVDSATKQDPVIFTGPYDSIAVHKEGGKYVVRGVSVQVRPQSMSFDLEQFQELVRQKKLI
jgi:hypothetical protein